ncbi:hypothetical protein ACQ4PT_044606 [Festuca glaucescens]
MDGGGAHELKLLGSWASPYVARVKLALHLKGVHYSYAEEDLADKSDLLLRSNPVHKAVPVLIHNGRPVCESQVIMQYLDEASPAAGTDEERAEWKRQRVAAVGTLEEGLSECSGGKGSFFGGECVGYVDALLGGVVPWVRATEKLSGDRFFDAGEAPLLAAWMERFGELDAAKAVFQDVDALVE